GHPAGAPATAAVRLRLVPPGPTTNTRNVFPAFADVKFTSTSSNWHVNGFNCPLVDGFSPIVIVTGFAAVVFSRKITLVTPGVPFGRQKHAPEISRSWIGSAQLPSDGVMLNTTGALVPNANEHVVVRVNGPNTLLSPSENV